MFLGFEKKTYKESKGGLSKYVPWAFMADCEGATGVVIQKAGPMPRLRIFCMLLILRDRLTGG